MIFGARIILSDGRAPCPFCGATSVRPHIPSCRAAGRRIALSSALHLAGPPIVDPLVRRAFAAGGAS